jgi:hypothetical protein
MLDPLTRDAIRDAFLSGNLRVASVDPETGVPQKCVVTDVLRHTTPKRMVRLTLEGGQHGDFTEDHSVFAQNGQGITPVKAGTLAVGDPIVILTDGGVAQGAITTIEELGVSDLTYDLSVPGPENFALSNGILAHNTYSIGGISLDLERSSKYESLKQNSESQFDKASTAKQQTVKFIRGLQQPKYGIGIRSSFGPFVGRGVLSPRGFL